MSEPRIVVVDDAATAAQVAAAHVAGTLRSAVDARGRADWATTGGSTAPDLYRALAMPPARDAVPWPAVHVWWGDDRFVPRGDPLSNVTAFDAWLASAVALDPGHVHPFPTSEVIAAGDVAASAAQRLAADLAGAGLAVQNGFPVLDLVLLGVGSDGHILSVFPGSAAFDTTDWVVAIPAPTHIEPHVERVTMHPAVVSVGRDVLVVATGSGKADVLAEVLGPTRDERRWPAQLARHDRATWILDEAAAARLDR
jgi:6-phosphogluconolactonase